MVDQKNWPHGWLNNNLSFVFINLFFCINSWALEICFRPAVSHPKNLDWIDPMLRYFYTQPIKIWHILLT